ncbi:hypothetical protein BT69DRAFT_1195171, partial [Atractiella rhizophila]
LSPEEIETFQVFELFKISKLSRRNYERLRYILKKKVKLASIPQIMNRLKRLASLDIKVYERCINSCINYECPQYKNDEKCQLCGEARWKFVGRKRIPRATWKYVPLIPRLVAMAADPGMAEKMSFRGKNVREDGCLNSVLDGLLYRKLCNTNVVIEGEQMPYKYFQDSRDVFLAFYTDGFALWKR